MKDISIRFKITSLDSSVEFDTVGEYKNNRIKFLDPEDDVNYIIKHKDTIEYYKKGQVDMKYKFNLDAVTKGYYTIAHNKFEFDIVTNLMTIEDDHIYIKYDLYQSNELVNQTELTVGYQVKEES
jgi:uncharacterized beta-barrel protein YwiB (DUF1934 family)